MTFPANPSLNATNVEGRRTFTFDGEGWRRGIRRFPLPPPPPPPPPPPTVFFDDYNRVDLGPIYQDVGPNMQIMAIVANEFQLRGPAPGLVGVSRLVGLGNKIRNFDMTVKVRPNDRAAPVIFWRTNYWPSPMWTGFGNGAYNLYLPTAQMAGAGGRIDLRRGTDSPIDNTTVLANPLYSFQSDTPYLIRVLAQGDSHKVYIDGGLVMDVTDATHLGGGYFALGMYWSQDFGSGFNNTLEYDDLNIDWEE